METRGERLFFLRIRSVLIQSIIKFYLILKKLRDNVKKKIKIDFFFLTLWKNIFIES